MKTETTVYIYTQEVITLIGYTSITKYRRNQSRSRHGEVKILPRQRLDKIQEDIRKLRLI